MAAKNKWLHVRASDVDKDKLEIIRKHEGLENASETVRKLIDNKYREIVRNWPVKQRGENEDKD